jgi:hypothetical protein
MKYNVGFTRQQYLKFRESYSVAGDGIPEHQFNKKLEPFALCYSQFLLLADFKENQTLLWF